MVQRHHLFLTKPIYLSLWPDLRVFQLFELILHREMKVIDFSQNKHLVESDVMNDVAKTLWKIISEKCTSLSKFIVPKELSYCSTMDGKNKQVPKNILWDDACNLDYVCKICFPRLLHKCNRRPFSAWFLFHIHLLGSVSCALTGAPKHLSGGIKPL